MTFTELISAIRHPYVTLLAETAAAQACVVEPALLDKDGDVMPEGTLNTGSRLDLVMTGEDGDDEAVRVDSSTQLAFEPFEFDIDAMRVVVAPFAWDWASLDIEGLPEDVAHEVLRDWFVRWFEEDESNVLDDNGLLGVVHFISDPVERPEGGVSVNVDLGSSPVEVIDDLLFRLLDAGANRVGIGQPDDEHQHLDS